MSEANGRCRIMRSLGSKYCYPCPVHPWKGRPWYQWRRTAAVLAAASSSAGSQQSPRSPQCSPLSPVRPLLSCCLPHCLASGDILLKTFPRIRIGKNFKNFRKQEKARSMSWNPRVDHWRIWQDNYLAPHQPPIIWEATLVQLLWWSGKERVSGFLVWSLERSKDTMLRWMWNRGQVSLKKRSPANQSSAKLHWSYFLVATQNSTQASNWLNINFVALLLSITFPKPKVVCLFLGEINHSSPFCLFSSIIKSTRLRAQKRRNCRRRFSPSPKMSSLGFPTSPPTWTGTPCSGWKRPKIKMKMLSCLGCWWLWHAVALSGFLVSQVIRAEIYKYMIKNPHNWNILFPDQGLVTNSR